MHKHELLEIKKDRSGNTAELCRYRIHGFVQYVVLQRYAINDAIISGSVKEFSDEAEARKYFNGL
jgi:hypothetical protein